MYYSIAEVRAFKLEVEAIHTLSNMELPSAYLSQQPPRLSMKALVRQSSDATNSYEDRRLALAKTAAKLNKWSCRLASSKSYDDTSLAVAKAKAKLHDWSMRIALETARLDLLEYDTNLIARFQREKDLGYLVEMSKRANISPFSVRTKRRRVTTEDF